MVSLVRTVVRNYSVQTIVMLDCNLDEELEKEGVLREVLYLSIVLSQGASLQVTNRVQRARKEAKLVSTDAASVYLEFASKVRGERRQTDKSELCADEQGGQLGRGG